MDPHIAARIYIIAVSTSAATRLGAAAQKQTKKVICRWEIASNDRWLRAESHGRARRKHRRDLIRDTNVDPNKRNQVLGAR